MAKNVIYALLGAAGLTLSVVGCQDLTERPDFASPESFFKNGADMEAAINGAYAPLNQQWFNTFYNRCVFDCALGITTGYEKGPQYYKQGSYVASDEYIDAYWRDNYDGINRANTVLARIAEVPTENISTALKTRIMGEAHFLRALYYYQLYVFFENIPVVDKPTAVLGEYASNDGGKVKALALMTADLTAAENELPAQPAGGRPTRWAAKTLLAKVHLEAGRNNEAAAKAEEVIRNSGLTLFSDFSKNFDVENENMGERLFEIQNDFFRNPTNFNNMHAHFTPTDWDGGNPFTLEPGDNVTAAGWGDAWIVGDTKFRAQFANGDRRINPTFMEQYRSKNAGGDVVRYDPNAPSPFIAPGSPDRRYKNVIFQKVIEYRTGGWQNTRKNFVILRLADAYLVHSEAVANGAPGDAYFGINAIRQRAGLTPLSGLSNTALKNEIFWEWLREFAGEGWAFATARRFNKTAELIRDYAGGRVVDNNKWRLLPLPLVELNANPGLKQNTGW